MRSTWHRQRAASGRACPGRDGPDTAQLMLLTAFILVIAFVALSGMVAHVTQLPAETRQSAERPIFTESRSISAGLEELATSLVSFHGGADGWDVDNASYEFNAAVRHLGVIQSGRGFGFTASPLVCTDRGDDGTGGGTNTIRLWMDFTIRDTNTKITRSMSVEVDGLDAMMPCPDPGFAFEDANGDMLYRLADGDVELAAAAVTDGSHTTAAGRGLVIPRSVGVISAGLVSFQAHGNSWFDVDLTATGAAATADVIVQTSSGDVWVAGHALTAQGSSADVQLGSSRGVHIEWATLTADSTDRGSTVDECAGILAATSPTALYVEGATVEAGQDGHANEDVFNAASSVRVVGTFANGSAGSSCTN